MKYKVIGFDYGGVIHKTPGSDMEAMADFFGMPIEKVRTVFFENNYRVNVEKTMNWIELWEHIAKILGLQSKSQDVASFINEREKKKEIDQDLVQLICDLRSAGYSIGLLSNYSSSLHGRLEEQGIAHLFDSIATSSEMQAMKPQPEAFYKFCAMLGIEPQDLVFIDDSKKSLETAGTVGYTPILFRGFENLCEELKILKVL